MLWPLAVRDYGGALEFVHVICLYLNLYTYKASESKRTIIRLHCATSKSSLWNMGYVAHGGAFKSPRIYRTNVIVSFTNRVLEEFLNGPNVSTDSLLSQQNYWLAANSTRQWNLQTATFRNKRIQIMFTKSQGTGVHFLWKVVVLIIIKKNR